MEETGAVKHEPDDEVALPQWAPDIFSALEFKEHIKGMLQSPIYECETLSGRPSSVNG